MTADKDADIVCRLVAVVPGSWFLYPEVTLGYRRGV